VHGKLALRGGVALAIALAVAPVTAYARGESGGLQLPKHAPPVTPDGKQAKAILERIEADAGAMKIAKDAVERGEKALARAEGA
jgi:hypothetical protein